MSRQEVKTVAERLADTWTKLRVFELVDYDKIIFLDADMMILCPMDELFDVHLPGADWLGATHACKCHVDHDPLAPPEGNSANCLTRLGVIQRPCEMA